MKPAPFKYVAARSAEDAISHLSEYGGEARLLAGGQSLIPLMNFRVARPAALIDLRTCNDLSYLYREGDWLVTGPMTTQSTAEHSPLVRECCPLVSTTMRYLGHPTIRNRGTIGGTLAHADRIAELPGVAVALGAQMTAQGPTGRRTIEAEKFFIGDLTTALRPDEMLREIRFPVASSSHRSAFVEATNRHHDLAIVGVAVDLDLHPDGTCTGVRLAAVGVGPKPARLQHAEACLRSSRVDNKTISEAGGSSLEDVEFEDDVNASAAYRKHVMPGLVEQAVRAALRSGTGT
jgi:aerobic carbon-monoxide dehydrogenase medium subunit